MSARTSKSFHTQKSLKSLYFLPIVMEMFLPAGKIVISHSNIDGTTGSNDAQFKPLNSLGDAMSSSQDPLFQSGLHHKGTDSTS